MAPENVEIVRHSFEAFARGDFETAFAAHDPSTEWCTAADEPDQQTYQGIAGLRSLVGSLADPWEDRFGHLMEFEEFIDRGDWVVVPWSARLQGKGESTRLGALKLRLALLDARLRIFPGIGLVPSEVERARLEADFIRVVRQMLIILDRHGVPEHVEQEIVDAAEGRLPPGPEAADGETPGESSIAEPDVVEPVDAYAAPGW